MLEFTALTSIIPCAIKALITWMVSIFPTASICSFIEDHVSHDAAVKFGYCWASIGFIIAFAFAGTIVTISISALGTAALAGIKGMFSIAHNAVSSLLTVGRYIFIH